MATIADTSAGIPDALVDRSGRGIARAIDRWIYVFTAASFIAITLTGFIPDSVTKIAAVQAGQRAPFPIVLPINPLPMGALLLLLLAPTILAAAGRVGPPPILRRSGIGVVAAVVGRRL